MPPKIKNFSFKPHTDTKVQVSIGISPFRDKKFLASLKKKKVALIADQKIDSLLAPLKKMVKGELFFFSGNEIDKTRKQKEKLEDLLLEKKFGKDSLFIAVGGGTTLDLVGYLASTFSRGVPLVLFPTTLLAMVDAAIGGKTGVNTPFGKNLIGTIYSPKRILIDLSFLKTLPKSELLNGLAEILKYGLVYKSSLWKTCVKNQNTWQELKILKPLIFSSIQTKIEIVKKDPLEEIGPRRILNFGHTIGHGIEKISNYKIPHGQAVAFGCVVESWLSMHLGYLPKKTFSEIESSYRNFGFSLKLPKEFKKEAFLNALKMDKKNRGGKIGFVLIEKVGKALSFQGDYSLFLEAKKLDPLISWMEKHYG